MYAQAPNIEAFEQMPMPAMERVADANPNPAQGIDVMPEGAYAQRNPQALARISFNQPEDPVSPGLRRAVDKAVDNAFGNKAGSTDPEATASDATQDCVNAALNGLHIKTRKPATTMFYPGDRRKQEVGTEARLDPVSSECLSLINRETPRIFFRMQRPNNHKKLIKTRSQIMVDGDNNPVDGNEGNSDGRAFVTASGNGGMKAARFLYRCTPGKGITHVQAVYLLRVDSAVDGSELGHRTVVAPVNIFPVPPKLVQGGGVPDAC